MKPDDLPDPWSEDLCHYGDKSDSIEAASWCAAGLVVCVLLGAVISFGSWLIQ